MTLRTRLLPKQLLHSCAKQNINCVSVSRGLDWLCLILQSSVLTMERTSETCHLVHKVTGAGSTYDLMNLWQVQCPPWQLQGNTTPALSVQCTAPAQWTELTEEIRDNKHKLLDNKTEVKQHRREYVKAKKIFAFFLAKYRALGTYRKFLVYLHYKE